MTKKVAELREKRAELADEAQAILNVAETENRELSKEEDARFTAIMADETGELAKLDAEIAKAEKFEAEKKRLLAARIEAKRAAGEPFAGPAPVEQANASQSGFARHVPPTLKAFKTHEDALTAGMFLAAVITGDEKCKAELERRGTPLRMTQNEGTGSKGGYLVPAPMVNSIIAIRQTVGVAPQLATMVGMSSATLELPKETSGCTVYYPGEEGSITASDVDFEKVKLEVTKRAARCLISNEVNADAIISMTDWVTRRMGYDFAYQLDNELFNGDGTSTYGKEVGLKSALGSAGVYTAASGVDTWPELVIGDFHSTIAKLPERWFGYGPKWVCSRAFHSGVMEKAATAAGGNTVAMIKDGALEQRFLGYPVVFSDFMPTATAASTVCCLFGAFSEAVVLGDRNDMSLGVSEHAAWSTDQLDLRVTHRYDILVHEGGDASAAGAYVGLKTNS